MARRFKHNLSHYRITSMYQGDLVPVGCVEVLPGDSFRHSTACLVRVGTLVRPVMHPTQVRVHHWFVPNRLTWADWDDFITGTNTTLTVPTITVPSTTGSANNLFDHLGASPNGTASYAVNALPFRAYNMVWNENYRDQDLSAAVSLDNTAMRKVSWEKDYFTVARTNAAFGGTVSVPIYGIGKTTGVNSAVNQSIRDSRGQIVTYPVSRMINASTGVDGEYFIEGTAATGGFPNVRTDITLLRQALSTQKFLERRARFGHRFTDYLRFLGVKPSDGRLDQPEYLGGGVQTIAYSEVLATAEGASTAVGEMFGHGIAGMRTRPYKRFFEEHGYVLTLISVRPKSAYYNTVPRHFLRSKHLDFWQREFENLGPQAILQREVTNLAADNTSVFGYGGRNDDYRQIPSTIHGEFRTPSHDEWHFGRTFPGNVALNQNFVECVPSDLPFADATDAELFVQVNHRLTARRLVRPAAMMGML